MKEELQEKTITALTDILTSVTEAKDFVLAELPEVIHQILMWELCSSILDNVVAIVLPIILTVVLLKVWCKPKSGTSNRIWSYYEESDRYHFKDDDFCLTMFIISGVISIVTLIISLTAINTTFIKIWLAPKLFLIEYAAKLV